MKENTSHERSPLDEVIEFAGSMQALAKALGVTRGAVFQWRMDGRRVPAEHCPKIERLTFGRVKCERLRPDVDWAYIRASKAASEAKPA